MTKFGHVHTKHFFLPSIVLDDVIARAVALRDSVVHYQTISQDQQPHWLTTGGCTAWYFTLLLSLTSSEHDAHVMYPADDLMLLTDPPNVSKLSCLRPLGFVFNHQLLLQHASSIFLLLASADSGLDNTHTHTFTPKWLTPRC